MSDSEPLGGERRLDIFIEPQLWGLVELLEKRLNNLNDEQGALYPCISGVDYNQLSRKDAAVFDSQSNAYMLSCKKSNEVADLILEMYRLLEQIGDGDTTLFDLIEQKVKQAKALLEIDDACNRESDLEDPRKRNRKLGKTAAVFSGLETDPRRIETGRNATRVVWAGGISPEIAESAFMDASSGTHGGKVRYSGKNGNVYVGPNGRRVRKK